MGGFVESKKNLSQKGNCWIYNDAKVFDNAMVYGSAVVSCSARVYDYARVFNCARVFGSASVFGFVRVGGYAMVYGSTSIYGFARVGGSGEVQEFSDYLQSQICHSMDCYDARLTFKEKINEVFMNIDLSKIRTMLLVVLSWANYAVWLISWILKFIPEQVENGTARAKVKLQAILKDK